MVVTGVNPQTIRQQTFGSNGYELAYTGNKAGLDKTSVSFTVGTCTGYPGHTVVITGAYRDQVGWGNDYRDFGNCKAKYSFKSRYAGAAAHRKCYDDPYDEGLGSFETQATDAFLRPQVCRSASSVPILQGTAGPPT